MRKGEKDKEEEGKIRRKLSRRKKEIYMRII
jgi:hypothetical protein